MPLTPTGFEMALRAALSPEGIALRGSEMGSFAFEKHYRVRELAGFGVSPLRLSREYLRKNPA